MFSEYNGWLMIIMMTLMNNGATVSTLSKVMKVLGSIPDRLMCLKDENGTGTYEYLSP